MQKGEGKGEEEKERRTRGAACSQQRATVHNTERTHTDRHTHCSLFSLTACLSACLTDSNETHATHLADAMRLQGGEPVNRGGRHAEDRAVPPIAASKQRGGEGGGRRSLPPPLLSAVTHCCGCALCMPMTSQQSAVSCVAPLLCFPNSSILQVLE